jgi:hypothetical protein
MILGLAGGCSGYDDAVVNARTPPPPNANTRSDCARAAYEIEGALQGTASLRGVRVPSCAKAYVSTSLGVDGVAQAVDICRTATSQTAVNSVTAVGVVSADGTELASGTTAEDCAAASSAPVRPTAPARRR